jgi:hypothetical protein
MTSAGGRGLDAYPDRSVAVVRAFQRPLNRALQTGGVVAVFVALLLVGARVDEGYPGTVGIVAIGLLGGLLGVAVAILAVPRRLRRAFEAYSWLGHDEVRRFRERTGGPVPVGREAMDQWLAATPATPTMQLPRVELLAFVGSFDEARTELDTVPATDPDVAFEVAALRQYIDWLEHDASDMGALRSAANALAVGTRARLAADVTLALVDSRMRIVHGNPAWSAPLEAIRGRLGWAPWRATLVDTWRPVGALCILAALIASVVAVLFRSAL